MCSISCMKPTLPLFACIVLGCSWPLQSLAEAIYRSVDANGEVVFSDQPSPGAQPIEPAPLNTMPALPVNSPLETNPDLFTDQPVEAETARPATPSASSTQAVPPQTIPAQTQNSSTSSRISSKIASQVVPDGTKSATSAVVKINSLTIVSPTSDITLIDLQQPISVKLRTSPGALEDSNLTAELWMDDARVVTGTRAVLKLPVPFRGTHTLYAQLVNKAGITVTQSEPITIHVRHSMAGGN